MKMCGNSKSDPVRFDLTPCNPLSNPKCARPVCLPDLQDPHILPCPNIVQLDALETPHRRKKSFSPNPCL